MTQFTRCPECDTAFIVTDEHLALAGGKVRCGNCKAIFDARQFLSQIRQQLQMMIKNLLQIMKQMFWFRSKMPSEETIHEEVEAEQPQEDDDIESDEDLDEDDDFRMTKI